MLCKRCNVSPTLIKAHIIPEAFFRAIRGDGGALRLASPKNDFIKNAPIGAYDGGILCAQCEALFDPLDTYGAEILLNQKRKLFESVSLDSGIQVLSSRDVDKNRLLRFLVSILWRAHVSTHEFYQRVNLGPCERKARLCVETSGENFPTEFDAILFQRTLEDFEPNGSGFLVAPSMKRFADLTAYYIDLGEVSAFVKVDSRPFHAPFDRFALRSDDETLILPRGGATPKELNAMSGTVHQVRARTVARKKHR